MSPKTIIYKLNELKWKARPGRTEVIDKAIEMIKRHAIAKEYDVRHRVGASVSYHCPNCGEFIGFEYSLVNMPFNYCYNCGQKLKMPKEG